MSELTRFEEQITLSVWKLQDEAYGISIYQHIRNITKINLAMGGIYFPLERLVKKGFLKARMGEPTPIRGGQGKRYYRLTELGKEALIKAKKTQEAFWEGIYPLRISSGENK
jgi:PadR family transcriptional regulator PadR